MRVLPGGVPRGTPSLTFDDGPAKDTEALLDVLARHRRRQNDRPDDRREDPLHSSWARRPGRAAAHQSLCTETPFDVPPRNGRSRRSVLQNDPHTARMLAWISNI